MFTKSKIINSGDIFETFNHEDEIWQGKLPQQNRPQKTGERKKAGSRTDTSFFRAKSRVRRLIDANMVLCTDKLRPRFVSFTFKKNIQEIKKANYFFTRFMRKFKQFLKPKKVQLKYITVIEFQKRGAIHYHTIFFNLPYFENMYDEMERLWGHGYVISEKIDRIKSLSSYVCKYMVKDISDNRLYGEKCYFSSRGLNQPWVCYNDSVVKFVSDFMPEEIKPYEKIYESNHGGITHYRRYDLAKHQELKKSLLAFIK